MHTIDAKYRRLYDDLLASAPFERDIQNVFTVWRNSKERSILRLDGARQIGKTTEILKFAYRNYANVLYLNLVEGNNKKLFEDAFSGSQPYVDVLSEFFGEFINSRSTILIIDEIQYSPNIYNRIKEFKRQLKCDIIMTGSYLGRILSQDIYNVEGDLPYFVPMGDVHSHTMHVMSYKEFCSAFGYSDEFSKHLIAMTSKEGELAALFKDLFELYKAIGGYPAIVRLYKSNENLVLCYQQLEQLLLKFKEESLGYYNSDNKIQIFDDIFSVVLNMMLKGETVKNFSVDLITSEIKSKHKDLAISRDEINKALTWIINSGVIGVCHRYNDGDVCSVTCNAKLYFKDLGILNLLKQQYSVNSEHFRGLLTETFAYNELNLICSAHLGEHKVVRENVVHYSTSNNYELDFMLSGSSFLNNCDKLYGIEIKAGDGSHKSINYYKRRGLVNKCVISNNSDILTDKGNGWVEIPVQFVGHLFWYGDDVSIKEIKIKPLSLFGKR